MARMESLSLLHTEKDLRFFQLSLRTASRSSQCHYSPFLYCALSLVTMGYFKCTAPHPVSSKDSYTLKYVTLLVLQVSSSSPINELCTYLNVLILARKVILKYALHFFRLDSITMKYFLGLQKFKSPFLLFRVILSPHC